MNRCGGRCTQMVRIEAELREEREAVIREREKVRVAEEAISEEANAKEAAQLAKLAERREAVRWLAPLHTHTQPTQLSLVCVR